MLLDVRPPTITTNPTLPPALRNGYDPTNPLAALSAAPATSALPKETPPTAFGATAVPEQDPMRNFGFTVSAYAVLWVILVAFVVLSFRKQQRLDRRVAELETALQKADRK